MKNRRSLQTMLFAVGLSAILLSGCGHEHEWKDATCTEPKTCETCGKTEGEALGHTWVEATCTEPKTCSVCGVTEGETLDHTWVEATCTNPKTCSVCGATEGEALGHTWVDATYEAPKTCTVCGVTEGEPLTLNLVGAFQAEMNGTYFDLTVNSQNGDELNIDLSWYNMRMGENLPTMDITLTDGSATFSGVVEGAYANGSEREFTVTFQDDDHATIDIGNGDILDMTRIE